MKITKLTLLNHFSQIQKKQLSVLAHTELPENALSASVLVPILEEDELTVLFTERTAHLTYHAGQISFPGGRYEVTDSSLKETCLRETAEEIGVQPQQINIIGLLPSHMSSSGLQVTPYVGLIKSPLALTINPFEVTNVFTVPLHFLLNKKNWQHKTIIHQEKPRKVHLIKYSQYEIWGLTARIIVDLARELEIYG